MKKIYSLQLVFCLAVSGLFGLSAAAQGGSYFRENFANGSGPTSDPGATPTQVDFTGENGLVWKFFGLWITTGTSCLLNGAPPPTYVTGTGNRHIRSSSNNTWPTTDTAYTILPEASAGIYSVILQRSRTNRRLTFWVNNTNTTNAADGGWTLANVIAKSASSPAVLCDDTAVIINNASARRLMIKFERAGNMDVDSIELTSVGTLPSRLGESSAQLKKDGVLVSWQASNEVNVRGYYVQRSEDGGITFKDVAFVASYNKLESNYTYTDKGAGTGLVFYRIKGQDLDGRTNYGKVVKLHLNKTEAKGVWVINPVAGRTIELQLNNLPKGVYSIQVIDASGKSVTTKSVNVQSERMSTSLPLNAGVAKGMYVVSVRGAGVTTNKRVVVE